MPTVHVVTRSGEELAISAPSGRSLMEAIRAADIQDLLALCGGSCACATCHVFIDEAWIDRVGVPTSDEAEMLTGTGHLQPLSRLSCQIILTDALGGLRVAIAPEG